MPLNTYSVLQVIEPLAYVDILPISLILLKNTFSMPQSAVPVTLIGRAIGKCHLSEPMATPQLVCLSLVLGLTTLQIENQLRMSTKCKVLQLDVILVDRICEPFQFGRRDLAHIIFVAIVGNPQAIKQLLVFDLWNENRLKSRELNVVLFEIWFWVLIGIVKPFNIFDIIRTIVRFS